MDVLLLVKALAAFVFVIALMLLVAWGVRKSGVAQALMPAMTGKRRLKLVEVLPLDSRRRLVIVRRDGVEHLLLLGAQGERVIETGIAAPADSKEGEKHA